MLSDIRTTFTARNVLLALLAFIVCGGILYSYHAHRAIRRILDSEVISQNREIRDVRSLAIEGMGKLDVVQGEEETLSIEAPEDLFRYITTEVRNGELVIRIEPYMLLHFPHGDVTYHLVVRDLESIDASGSLEIDTNRIRSKEFTFRAMGSMFGEIDLEAEKLNVVLKGSSRLTVLGIVGEQDVILDGAGSYVSEQCESASATLHLTGATDATVRVRESLHAFIDGQGTVNYVGDPKEVEYDVSGSGKIKRIGD